MDERLDGRAGVIWQAYIAGLTQEAIAAEHGISQQRVSQILAAVREVIPADARQDALLLDLERLDRLVVAFMPLADGGDVKAAGVVLRVTERRARALGYDATEPLRVTLERHLDDEGQLVADALAAALDVLGLTEEQRIAALGAAQARLLGEDPPTPIATASPPGPSVDDAQRAHLEDDFRKFAAENGFDPDEDDDEDEDDQEEVGDGGE